MNNLNTSDVRVPSGFEVESITTHRNENRMLDDHTHDGGVKDKLYHWRSMGMDRINSLKSDVNDRIETWKPIAQERVTSMRSGMNGQIMKLRGQISNLQSQMKSDPGKWAGIAAGAGLGLGLLGRMLRHRSRMRDADLPHIVIVGAC